jgi:two-component system sensor kinase FixL
MLPQYSAPGGDDQLFQALIASAVDGIVVIDTQGRVELYNSSCERLFQYAPDEVIGNNVRILIPQSHQIEHEESLSRYRHAAEKLTIGSGRETVGQRKDCSTFPMFVLIGEGVWNEKQVFVAVIHDLTAMKADLARQESATRLLAQIVKSSDDAIITKTLEGVITSWNSAAERMFGFRADEAIGQHVAMLIPECRHAEETQILSRISAGESIHHYETIRHRKNGEELHVSLSVAPILDTAGKVVGASKIVRDITRRRSADSNAQKLHVELAHSSRLNAMGQMSAAIAHELNQPLAAMMNYVKAAQRLLASDMPQPKQIATARDAMSKAAKQIVRASSIIRYLREFVEKRGNEKASSDVNRAIREAVELGLMGADTNVKVILDLDRKIPPAMIDKIQIQQVLINLIRNSLEAMEGVKDRELTITSSADESGCLHITVCDSGPGFAPEVVAKLFEPFTTTKEKGMGIGLSICREIVDAHGGSIRLLPEGDQGTCFLIRLPVAVV